MEVDLDLVDGTPLEDLAVVMRLERLLEKAREEDEEMGLCFCLEGSRWP